jgi:hypothetical protein
LDSLEGVLNGVRGIPLLPAERLPDAGLPTDDDGLRKPLKFNLLGGALRGDSGRGSDGRRTRGRGIDGGPTDLLKLVEIEGRDGVGGVTTVRLVTYLELLMGTKMPAPAMAVEK